MNDISVVEMNTLTEGQRIAVEKAGASLRAARQAKKSGTKQSKTTVLVEGIQPSSEPLVEEKVSPRGVITHLEVATTKERVFVVNGIKFFAAVTESHYRVLSACDENKKTLESAGRVLGIKGYSTKIKRVKKDKTLWILEAKEKVPSGPWPDEDQKPIKEEST